MRRTGGKWVRKYTGYFILAGIAIVGFLAGMLTGANIFNSTAVSAPEEPKGQSAPVLVISASAADTEPETKYFDIPLSTEIQDYTYSLCDEYEVPCELVYGMIEVESSFRANVISETNDYGLMQINKCNHEWLAEKLGITDILDPKQNILAGVYMISSHLESTEGDIPLALMQYNWGETGAKRLWDQGIYSTEYTDKVVTAYEKYKKCRP